MSPPRSSSRAAPSFQIPLERLVAEDILITRPGPRLPEGLRALVEAIRPDALP